MVIFYTALKPSHRRTSTIGNESDTLLAKESCTLKRKKNEINKI